jgi:Ca2+-binding EF-hand superfamily protein
MSHSQAKQSTGTTNHSIVARLSRAERQDLKNAFDLFDRNDQGMVAVADLKSILKDLQYTNKHLEAMFETTNRRNDSDQLNFEDFCALLTKADDTTTDDLHKAFALFDSEGKGYIDIHDLKQIAEDLGESMADIELEEMVQRASPSGRVSFDDFAYIMNKKLYS